MTDVKLIINDNQIPLNNIMQEMLSNIIQGYLKSAKKIPEDIKSINVEIKL